MEESEEAQSQRRRPKAASIASWFEGSSEPVNIGLVATPKKELEQEESIHLETMFSASQESIPRTSTTQQRPVMQSANNSTSRFSFFSRKASTLQLHKSSDDLVNLNISQTLFPDGPTDESSLAAFKDLQQNAEGALRVFQAAYTEHVAALRKITSEKNIQADELEASTTRNEHLKAQLLEMAERNAQHEKLIASLQAENEQLRANEDALRSIRVIEDHTSADRPATPTDTPTRRNRSSDVSFAESLESASTDVSAAASVFSHENDRETYNGSPGTSIGCPSPMLKHACRVVTPNIQRSPQTEHLRSLTTNIETIAPMPAVECQKCHGVRKHEAWEVLGVMKAENAGLKQRLMELEKTNEDAADLLTWRPLELDDQASKIQRMLSIREVDYEEDTYDLRPGRIC